MGQAGHRLVKKAHNIAELNARLAGHRLVKKAHNIAELNARLVEIYEEARSLYMSSRSKRA
jgi:hypothetical protein